jgi:hypothetical protein
MGNAGEGIERQLVKADNAIDQDKDPNSTGLQSEVGVYVPVEKIPTISTEASASILQYHSQQFDQADPTAPAPIAPSLKPPAVTSSALEPLATIIPNTQKDLDKQIFENL